MNPNQARIPALDGVRGLAILLVLVWHYLGMPLQAEPGTALYLLKQSLSLTWCGVDLFFVLSGFLIGGILLDHREAGNYYRVFYVRRALRIFPLYYAWLGVFWLLIGIGIGSFPWLFRPPLPWWSYASYTQNFYTAATSQWGANWMAMSWSLDVEEQFYALLPWLVRKIPAAKLPRFLIPVILLVPFGRWLLLMKFPSGPVVTYILFPCRVDTLLLGVLCAWAVRYRPEVIKRLPLRWVFALSSLALVSLVYNFDWLKTGTYGYSLLALWSASLLLLATEREGVIQAVTQLAWLRRAGWVAYGLYIFHQAANGVFHQWLFGQAPTISRPAHLVAAGGGLLVTFTLAALSWKYFESPLMRRGHRMKYSPAPFDDSPAALHAVVN